VPDVPYLRAADVEARLDWLSLADALRKGHQGQRPEIGDTFLHRGPDTLLSRAAWIDGQGIAVKSVTAIPGNAPDRPTIHGALVLFEDQTGTVQAIIDSALITKWKTAADSLLGAQLLAPANPGRMLIMGAGLVSASLVEAYRAMWPDLSIGIWNRTANRALALAEQVGADHVAELQQGVSEADIICGATMSHQPVLQGTWLKSGTHIDLIGAFKSDMREADDEVLRRSRLFVDSYATTLDHIGELKIPLAEGTITRGDVLGDLYDLCTGSPG